MRQFSIEEQEFFWPETEEENELGVAVPAN